MADLFEAAMPWLRDTMRNEGGQMVTYKRAKLSVDIKATIAFSEYEFADEQGTRIRYESRDFIVDADALILGVNTVKPQPGDKIVWRLETFEVMEMNDGRAYEPADSYETQWRIHTKQVI